jgi:endonuclease/exonuclease/phosphatase (EEP) superfamily protein YafD
MLVDDFNLDVSTNENAAFLDFMHDMFGLRLASTTAPTTIGDSCIDMVFIRNLDGLRCSRHISYFSYHRPLIAVYDYEPIESTQYSDLTQNK